jgi:lipoprotein-releasing system permease protein
MNVPFFIARRYLSSKRKKNVVNLITRISVIGICITTAALVILIAAFNGIESMVAKLYSEFDSNLIIRSSEGKTFDSKTISLKAIQQTRGVTSTSKAIEEVVVLKHEQKWVNAKLTAIEPSFLEMAQVSKHMVDGYPSLNENNEAMGLIGASLLDKLNGYIPQSTGYESLIVYFPKRKAKVSVTSNPFRTQMIKLSGRINYNKEVNDETLILPLETAAELLEYDDDISAVYVNIDSTFALEDVKQVLADKLGRKFEVKTHLEKNALIYQTSKTERIIVIGILIFVFILAAFNLVASLTMLYIEKKDNIKTLESMGASDSFIFSIFFYEGLLISFKGVLIGLVLGYSICFLQIYGNVIQMPNSGGESFPMNLTWGDAVLIVSLVGTLSLLASYLPVRYLVRKGKSNNHSL